MMRSVFQKGDSGGPEKDVREQESKSIRNIEGEDYLEGARQWSHRQGRFQREKMGMVEYGRRQK